MSDKDEIDEIIDITEIASGEDYSGETSVCGFVNSRLKFLNLKFDCNSQEVHIFVFIVLVWIGILLF